MTASAGAPFGNGLYPIIRRARRPLMPEEPPKAAPAPEEPDERDATAAQLETETKPDEKDAQTS